MSGILGLDKLGSFTLGASDGLNLITNRTLEDANEAGRLNGIAYDIMTEEQRSAWQRSLRGAYNASDLNRVESAVAQLAADLRLLPQELQEYGASLDVGWDAFFDVPYDALSYVFTTKTNWRMQDIPLPADMQRYLDNVKALRSAFNYATATLPDSMENLTWSGANAIEKALEGLNSAIIRFRNETKTNMDKTAAAWNYSGEIFTGEV